MAPQRGSDAPPSRLLSPTRSPRMTRAVRNPHRCRGGSPAAPRLLGRWLNSPVVLMILALAFLAAPGVIFVAKKPLGRQHDHHRRRRLSLGSDPQRRQEHQVDRADIASSMSMQQHHLQLQRQQRQSTGMIAAATTKPSNAQQQSPRHEEMMESSRADDGDGIRTAETTKRPRHLRRRLTAKESSRSNQDVGCKEIEAMLAGTKTPVGRTGLRNIFLVEHGERKLVVETVREDGEQTASGEGGEEVYLWESAVFGKVRGHADVWRSIGACGSSSVFEFLPSAALDDSAHEPGAAPLLMSSVASDGHDFHGPSTAWQARFVSIVRKMHQQRDPDGKSSSVKGVERLESVEKSRDKNKRRRR